MYCSIQEAFETTSPPTAPARRKKRDRERREPFVPDPDRPANVALPPADVVGGGIQQPSYSNLLTAIDADQSYFPHPTQDTPGEKVYMLEPDWTKQFGGTTGSPLPPPFSNAQFDGPAVPPWIKERIAAKEAEIPLKPWMDGQPTLWQKIPAAYTPPPAPAEPIYPDLDDRFYQFESKLDSKLERMFAKLGELEKGRTESNHIEIILFIIGGLFLLLMLDMLVKQGTQATMMLAAAGGGMDLYKRYMTRG